jgi:hypothetical protein
MNRLTDTLRDAMRRVLRGPTASRMLAGFGIHPRPFWLLVDLFGALSQRREVLSGSRRGGALVSELGRDKGTLKVISILYTVIMAFIGIVLVLPQPPVATYLSVFLGMTGLLIFSILIPETSNSLINPLEGLILAHQPINGATYTAAKLAHLLRILLYLVPVPNMLPALMGLALKNSHWYYPLEHLAAAFLLSVVLALFCCALFGWLLRFVPASRLKGAGQVAEILPMLVFFTFRYMRTFAVNVRIPALLSLGWPVVAGAAGLTAGVVVMGLRSLSGDYLVRVASIASGGSHGSGGSYDESALPRRARGAAFSRLLGGQKVHAGFAYLRIMMLRDLQFRRMMFQLLPSLVMLASILPTGLKIRPFSSGFTPLHFLPHLFGFILVTVCYSLPHGGHHKGAWVFLIVPSRVFAPFSRGVYLGLWLLGVAVPNLLGFAVLVWWWRPVDSAIFMAFSTAVTSLYLGLELRLIEAVPFSKPPRTSRGAVTPEIFVGMLLAAIAVGLQYFVIFYSPLSAILTTIAIGGVACLVTQKSLKAFEIAMQYNLALDSGEAAVYYQEVAT